MIRSQLVLLLLVICLPGHAQEVLSEIAFQNANLPPSASLQADGSLLIAGGNQPVDIIVTTIDELEIERSFFGVRGQMQYSGVTGEAWVRLDVSFDSGETYFSRKQFSGSGSDFLTLPFNATTTDGSKPAPVGLALRVILPGGGSVNLRDLQLVQGANWAELHSDPNAWWSNSQAGYFGGAGGALIGVLGALLGVLAARGRAVKLVWVSAGLLFVCGAIMLVAGMVALIWKQPYGVYYPLLLGGILTTVLMPLLIRRAAALGAEREQRSMAARDA